jgi:hypothetical protein
LFHQGLAQGVVDGAQSGHADPATELVQHAGIGQPVSMGQADEGSPSPLLRQQAQ